MIALFKKWFSKELPPTREKVLLKSIKKMRLRESYLRHKAEDLFRVSSKPKLQKQLLAQALNISEAAYTAECLVDSIETMNVMNVATAEMTRLAALSAAEDVMDRVADSVLSINEMAEVLATPLDPDTTISEIDFQLEEPPMPPSHVLSVQREKTCIRNSICS